TLLRQHPLAWHYVVVLTSGAGVFLVAIGLWIGWQRFRRHPRRNSPYRGVALWHHYGGLIFGALCLTWTFSGLMSMDPGGWLTGAAGTAERRALAGGGFDAGEIATLPEALEAGGLPAGTVRIESAPFAG